MKFCIISPWQSVYFVFAEILFYESNFNIAIQNFDPLARQKRKHGWTLEIFSWKFLLNHKIVFLVEIYVNIITSRIFENYCQVKTQRFCFCLLSQCRFYGFNYVIHATVLIVIPDRTGVTAMIPVKIFQSNECNFLHPLGFTKQFFNTCQTPYMGETHDCDDLLPEIAPSIMINSYDITICEAYESTHMIQRRKPTLRYRS